MRRLALLALLVLSACGDDEATVPSTTARSSPSTTEVSDLGLTEPYACGFGVALGAPDQAVGLFVHLADQAIVPTDVDLVGAGWDAELRQGTDLFANWCTDVIVDPVAEVEDVVAVVGGTVELEVGEGRGCPRSVTAELHDVELADGRLLGDLTVTASGWGCIPG
jgi:hypothetical protein